MEWYVVWLSYPNPKTSSKPVCAAICSRLRIKYFWKWCSGLMKTIARTVEMLGVTSRGTLPPSTKSNFWLMKHCLHPRPHQKLAKETIRAQDENCSWLICCWRARKVLILWGVLFWNFVLKYSVYDWFDKLRIY